MQLHHDYKKFEEKDTKIVVIGPANAESFREYWKENKLEFYGLSDEKHNILKLYAQEVSLFKMKKMAAQMLVDKEGVLRYVHYGNSIDDIPENDEIIELIDNL